MSKSNYNEFEFGFSKDSILDLSWDSKGQMLMATSWDGTIAAVIFRTDEIGEQMSFKGRYLLFGINELLLVY